MKSKFSSKVRLWLCGLLAAIGVLASVPAYADLTILPTRVVFEGRDRFGEVTLINTGKEAKTYELGWSYYKMQPETGTYERVEKSLTDYDLAQHIVISPRRVTLQPNEKQKIRLALRPAADTPPGEYRAHLVFRAQRDDKDGADTQGDGKAHVTINMNVGYSIPVFYSVGESDAGAVIEALTLTRANTGELLANIPVTRTGGAYSTHGYLEVYYTPPGGEEYLAGEVSNAHIFPEISHRIFQVRMKDSDMHGGTMRIVYRHFDKDRKLVYDQKTFPLAN
jgi:P pilus assembly chaperone PapD